MKGMLLKMRHASCNPTISTKLHSTTLANHGPVLTLAHDATKHVRPFKHTDVHWHTSGLRVSQAALSHSALLQQAYSRERHAGRMPILVAQ